MATHAGVPCPKLGMVELGRLPRRRCVAVLAVIAGIEVRCSLCFSTNCDQASIMALHACADCLGVVKLVGRHWLPKRSGYVAAFTAVAGCDVAFVLAIGCRAVVTVETADRDASVAECGARPSGQAGVAILADVGGLHVVFAFAICWRTRATVAAHAIGVAEYHGMEWCGCWFPCGIDMAFRTIARGLEMCYRLAGGISPIMADVTRGLGVGLEMVKRGFRPSGGDVACLAQIAGWHVLLVLAARVHAVVAFRATIHDARMIEYANVPRHVLMAGGAIIAGADMVKWLARGMLPVVTGFTRKVSFGVVELYNVPG